MKAAPPAKPLPRTVWIVAGTSFLTDISSEMIINTLPLFLSNVLGVKTGLIGLIEGLAESLSSLLKVFSGWFSDLIGRRKGLAVLGYGISTLAKPLYYFATSWGIVATARWGDRVGKGIRTAPRDALVADSVDPGQLGHAFGLHRAADTAGAFLGLIIAWLAVWMMQGGSRLLHDSTFRTLVLLSLLPAVLAVVLLAFGVRETRLKKTAVPPRLAFASLGRDFVVFMIIIGIFELGNSSDAFLILRAQERGLSVSLILAMLIAFNLVYALVSTPAGKLSDRIGRRSIIAGGWAFYILIYIGMALARTAPQIVTLYIMYGFYYGLTYGTAKALVSDIVPATVRGTAFGTYNAMLGIASLPASLLAGLLWEWFGPRAPFFFGAAMATLALAIFLCWRPHQPLPGMKGADVG
jgi:MFS family permease